jgi:hypothetical protein
MPFPTSERPIDVEEAKLGDAKRQTINVPLS